MATIPERIPTPSDEPFVFYRLPIYGIALVISLCLFSILPIVSLFGYIWEWFLGIIVGILGIGLIASIIGGVIALFVNPGVGVGLFILAWILYLLHNWLNPYYEYFITCSPWFYEQVWAFFYNYSINIYSWTPLMFILGCGCVAWLILFSAQFLNYLPRIIYGRIHCPYSNCDYVGRITIQCPHCGTMISNLSPTRYGIFSIPCPHCRNRLATGWLWGKRAYSKHCSQCLKDWNIRGLGTSLTRRVILMGAPQSGKTSFMVKSIGEMNRFYPDHIQYTTAHQESVIQSLAYELSSANRFQTKRLIERPAGVPVLFRTHPRNILAYFYDSPGNEFQPETTQHLFYENADGIFLFLDPFAEPEILEYLRVTSEQFPPEFEAAKQPADVIAGKLCGILEKVTGKGSDSSFRLPICVVLTKTEMFDLYKHIDSESFSLDHWEEHSRKVQEFLRTCGLNNFLGILESRFSHTMFFTSSAFTNYPQNELGYNSVLSPALWMMRQIGAF